MGEVLAISELGNPVLRHYADPVNNIREERIQTLIDNLIITASQANGVGIAAPQVGISDRLFIIASRPTLRYPNAPLMEPTAMINPKIINHSHETIKDWEGCLSVPGIRGLVPRYQALEIEYTNREGELCYQQLTDFVARIFQHELDHLNGIVFVDRVESNQDLVTEAEYQKHILDFPQ
ncbi:MAG: peptide deformylase [Planktothrix sp.]